MVKLQLVELEKSILNGYRICVPTLRSLVEAGLHPIFLCRQSTMYQRRSLSIIQKKPQAGIPHHIILLNAGIRVCASQNEKTSFGPVIKSLGVRPLKKELNPSLRIMFDTILKPLSGLSKFLF